MFFFERNDVKLNVKTGMTFGGINVGSCLYIEEEKNLL
jgi:hypothetical protein